MPGRPKIEKIATGMSSETKKLDEKRISHLPSGSLGQPPGGTNAPRRSERENAPRSVQGPVTEVQDLQVHRQVGHPNDIIGGQLKLQQTSQRSQPHGATCRKLPVASCLCESTLHVYITTVQSTSQNSLCVLSPPFSLTLSAAMVSARRPDVVALETHKL